MLRDNLLKLKLQAGLCWVVWGVLSYLLKTPEACHSVSWCSHLMCFNKLWHVPKCSPPTSVIPALFTLWPATDLGRCLQRGFLKPSGPPQLTSEVNPQLCKWPLLLSHFITPPACIKQSFTPCCLFVLKVNLLIFGSRLIFVHFAAGAWRWLPVEAFTRRWTSV